MKADQVEFAAAHYNLEKMNCNTFSRFMVQYLSPTQKELALDKLRDIIFETAQTANRIGNRIKRGEWLLLFLLI